MIIPSSVANGIQNDALKAMIVLHRPLDLRFSRHLWHHFCSVVSIQSYKFRDVALRRSHIVSFYNWNIVGIAPYVLDISSRLSTSYTS